MSLGLTTYKFCLRCDFTFSNSATTSFQNGTGASPFLTGSNTGNFYYEVYNNSTSLQSAIPAEMSQIGQITSTSQTVFVPSSSAVSIASANVFALDNQSNVTSGDRTSPALDPRRTPVIVIG